MASLKKRGKKYSIVFKKHINGKQVIKTYALGTSYKKVAEHKRVEYEKLHQRGEINPFEEGWSVKKYEKSQQVSAKPTTSDSYYLEDLKNDFLKYKAHVTESTKRGYKSVIKLFIEHVGRSMTAPLVKPADIRTFCLNTNYSNATQRNYYRHLKAFFAWMTQKEIISENPCDDVKPPKQKDNLVEKIFDDATLKTIFTTFRKTQLKHKKSGAITHDTQKQHWFKPLITTAYYTGLRRGELVRLRWEHVNLSERELYVTDTKGGNERTVIIFDQAYKRLVAWHKLQGYPGKGLVFPSPRSNDRIEIALIGDNVSKVFKSYVEKADVKDTIHFHSLRHSCATYMIKQGFDVTMVKEMLGHKSIQVTMRYVNLVVKDRKDRAKKLGLITDN